MEERVRSLDPIVDDRTAVLVLGSMPGRASLDAGQYYANPRNSFWRIVYRLFDMEPEQDYARRVAFLLENRVGLWDVIGECSRGGSLDTSIRDEVPNDLDALLASYPGIRGVFFNGAKSKKVFDTSVRLDRSRRAEIRFEVLPSTSPANASMSFEAKLERWRSVRHCLEARRPL